MSPEELEKAIAGIRSVHQATGHEGVAALAIATGMAKVQGSGSFDGRTFDFNQILPISSVKLPPQDLDSAMPDGWTVQQLDPWFQQLKNATGGSFGSMVEAPRGLSVDQLVAAWQLVRLFIDSGAILRQNIAHNVATARLQIEERGMSSVLVVLDEQYRVIEGLPYLWALSEMQEQSTVPAAILHGTPADAGWEHTHAEALKWGQTLWRKGEIQGLLEDSTPTEREYFQSFGFHQIPEITVLTLSWETFDRLGPLVEKQLGSGTKLDPAQLLFVEALREAVLDARQIIIEHGKAEQDDRAKLRAHLREEKDSANKGRKIAAANGWRWSENEDHTWQHPALPEFRFKIVESQSEAPARVDEPSQSDAYLMPLAQFKLLARDHFGIHEAAAAQLHEAEPPANFNRRLQRYVQAVEPMDRRGPKQSEDEKAKQAERLALWSGR